MKYLYPSIFCFTLLLLSGNLCSQQVTPLTQFTFNRFAFNPAVAGSDDDIPIMIHYRNQWAGFEDAPVTQSLSAHAFTGKGVGLGLFIDNDAAGPSRRTSLNFSGAYHYKMDREGRNFLSFGLTALFYQYFFDADKLRTDQPNDPAVIQQSLQNSRLTPDIAAGVYFSNDVLFLGISATQLVQTKRDIFSQDFNDNSLRRTYYVMGGYRIQGGNPNLAFEPSVLLKGIESSNIQADIILKSYYQQHWFGIGYRTSDAIAAMLGLRWQSLSIGYSYDFTLSDIQDFSSGTHEFVAGYYIFNTITRAEKQRREKNRRAPARGKNGPNKRRGKF